MPWVPVRNIGSVQIGVSCVSIKQSTNYVEHHIALLCGSIRRHANCGISGLRQWLCVVVELDRQYVVPPCRMLYNCVRMQCIPAPTITCLSATALSTLTYRLAASAATFCCLWNACAITTINRMAANLLMIVMQIALPYVSRAALICH